MLLESVSITLMFGTVAAKWLTATALQARRTRLMAENEKTGMARQRLKVSVNEVGIAERGIDRLERKVRAFERKIPQLQKQLESVTQEATKRAELDQQKLKLARDMKRKKGG